MKFLVFASVMVIILCISASASCIYTNPLEDGYGYTSFSYYYGVQGYEISDAVVNLSPYTQIISGQYGTENVVVVKAGIFLFPIDSLKGKILSPESVILNLYAQLNEIAPNPYGWKWEWWHCACDYGPGMSLGYYFPTENVGKADVLSNTPTWISVDVTQWVQNDINNGYSNSVFVLRYPQQTNSINYFSGYFWASESGSGPYLDIVPEPTSIFTLICGLSGVYCLIRRRRK